MRKLLAMIHLRKPGVAFESIYEADGFGQYCISSSSDVRISTSSRVERPLQQIIFLLHFVLETSASCQTPSMQALSVNGALPYALVLFLRALFLMPKSEQLAECTLA